MIWEAVCQRYLHVHIPCRRFLHQLASSILLASIAKKCEARSLRAQGFNAHQRARKILLPLLSLLFFSAVQASNLTQVNPAPQIFLSLIQTLQAARRWGLLRKECPLWERTSLLFPLLLFREFSMTPKQAFFLRQDFFPVRLLRCHLSSCYHDICSHFALLK